MTSTKPVALVTGASSGMGRDFALRLVAEGYAVYGAARQAQLGKNPPPSVISDLVVRALKAGRPATRYRAGRLAGPLLFLRKILSDRMFDRLTMLPFR